MLAQRQGYVLGHREFGDIAPNLNSMPISRRLTQALGVATQLCRTVPLGQPPLSISKFWLSSEPVTRV